MKYVDRVIEIEWEDACMEEADIPIELIRELYPIQRFNWGLCIHETKAAITLVFGALHNIYKGKTAYQTPFTFPKSIIKNIQILK